MSDTPTPITDANTYYAETLAISAEKIRVVHADFARQLERELAEAREQIENQKNQVYCATDLLENAIKQRDQLKREYDEERERHWSNLEALRAIHNAAIDLRNAKGRYNTEQAAAKLFSLLSP